MASPGEGVSGSESTVLDGMPFRGDQALSAAGVYSPLPESEEEVPIPETAPDGVEFSPKGLALASEKAAPAAEPPEKVSPEKLQNEVNEIAEGSTLS